HDPPRRKAAAIATAVDLEDDRLAGIARTQKIGVHGVGDPWAVDGLLGGGKGLTQDLSAEHVRGADVAAEAAEQVVFQSFQTQQVDQLVDGGCLHEYARSKAHYSRSGRIAR